MIIEITPMRAFLTLLYGAVLVLIVVAATRIGVLNWSRTTLPSGNVANAQILMIDPDVILKRFVEERAIDLEGEAFTNAVRRLDRIIALEAAQTYSEFGMLVVKADLVLAGGTDYTNAFFSRVLTVWDASL